MVLAMSTEQDHLEQTPETSDELRHQGYRLTEADEARVRAAVEDYYRRWLGNRPAYVTPVPGDQIEAMRRVGWSSIGCSEADLRDVELAWISNVVESTHSAF